MIYDPRRAALELRQRILDSMTPAELAEYVQSRVGMTEDAAPVVIRECEVCGQSRILVTYDMEHIDGQANISPWRGQSARCGCGETPINDQDIEALSSRGP